MSSNPDRLGGLHRSKNNMRKTRSMTIACTNSLKVVTRGADHHHNNYNNHNRELCIEESRNGIVLPICRHRDVEG